MLGEAFIAAILAPACASRQSELDSEVENERQLTQLRLELPTLSADHAHNHDIIHDRTLSFSFCCFVTDQSMVAMDVFVLTRMGTTMAVATHSLGPKAS